MSGKEQTKDGFWRERIRLGAGKRDYVTVPVKRETMAEDRLARLRVMAKSLVDSGKASEAPRIIADAAKVADDPKAFAGAERFVRDICAKVSGALQKPMTMRELSHLYTSGELARRHPRHVDTRGKTDRTRERERARLALLCEVIGDIAVVDLTLDDADKAMGKVPATASPAWRQAHSRPLFHLMDIACYPMRLIEHNPIPAKWVDKSNKPAETPILYPKEEARLTSCERLEFEERAMWGVQVREGMRPSGVAALRFRHIDFDNGLITHENKTKQSRVWDLGDDVLRTLRWLAEVRAATARHGAPDDDLVFPRALAWLQNAAERFREALGVAGLDRPDLYCENTRTRRKIRAHDLRTTFVTVALATGRSDDWIMTRTGHTTSVMLARYRRFAQTLEGLNLTWFAPLDVVLGVAQGVAQIPENTGQKAVSGTRCRSSKGASGRADVSKTPGKMTPPRPSAPVNVAHQAGGGPFPDPEPDGGGGPGATAPALGEDVLTELVDLATKARRWDLVQALGGQLEAIARARDAGKVRSLDRARRERGGK